MPAAALVLLAYVLVRYGWASPAGPHGPAFLANKIIAMLALGAMGMALIHPLRERRARAGRMGLALLFAHLLLTPVLLSPALYPKLYLGSGFTPRVELSFLAGATAAALFYRLGGPWNLLKHRAAQVALALSAFHLLALGGPGWFRPQSWPAGLPPLTLFGFLYASTCLVWGWAPRISSQKTMGTSPSSNRSAAWDSQGQGLSRTSSWKASTR